MKLFLHLLCSTFFCLLSLVSQGQVTATVFSATKDSYIISNEISANKGSVTPLNVGRYANRTIIGQPITYNTRRTVVEFDFSSIPSNAVIILAKLKLNQTASAGSPVIRAGRLKSSWTETSITWTNQPDFETGDLISSSSLVSGWLEIDVQDHVQGMVAGAYNNYGWLLLNNSETVNGNVYRNLRSKEDGTPSLRPKLEIEYYIPLEVVSAVIEHESSDGAEDGSVSPTLGNGPGGLSYKWVNSSGAQVGTSLNLVDVPYGWYGLEVSSTYTSDKFYYAFIVGLNCGVVEIPFNPGPNYVDDAMLFNKPPITSIQSESNYGTHPYVEATGMGGGPSQYRSLLKFRVWVDPDLIIQNATLNLTGHSNSGHSTYFKNVTSNWYENTVTHSSMPSLGATIGLIVGFMSIDATAGIVANVEDWQLDNNNNFGWLLELQTYSGTYGVYVRYYSSDNGTPSNRPNIDFTVAVSQPTSPHYCNQVFAKLERTLRGVKYKPYLHHLYFFYDEEYDVLGGELNYKVFAEDDQVTAVMDSTSDPIDEIEYGDNRYALDVGSLADGVYLLEVTNNKQEKFYLRFIK